MLVTFSIDFETDLLGNPLPAGKIISDQFQPLVTLITTNNPVDNPAIIFDSSNPTGGDTDLGTPNEDFGGPGIGEDGGIGQPGENSQSLGNVLIIAENTIDANGDGLIDDPDDDAIGGQLILEFPVPVFIQSVDVLDVGDNETFFKEIQVDFNGDEITTIDVPLLGINSFQTSEINIDNVTTLIFDVDGTFAIDNLVFSLPAASLGDFVWEDLNANGIQDTGEPGIEAVKVILTGGGKDRVIGTDDDTMDMTVTGSDGKYLFDGLNPFEEYKVTFNNPDPIGADAYMFSPRQVDGNPDSGTNSDGPMSDIVMLAPGEFNETIDAGLFRKGSIHVFGFLDEDGDGIQDNNEGAFPDDPGKTFVLTGDVDGDGNTDTVTATTVNGMVWFEGLTPGTYKVQENPVPDGFELTTLPNERTFTILSGQELVYEDGAAMLSIVDQRTEVNLGDDLRWGNTPIVESACIGDFVWEDLNANGIQDPDELDNGINGVIVKLLTDPNDDGVFDQIEDAKMTVNDPETNRPGFYKFNGLTPGVEYKIMFRNPDSTGPDAYMFSPRQVDGNPDSGTNSDGPMSDIVMLDPGEFNDTIDAGLFRKGSIHVFGFLDENGDGIQDNNEGAFPDNPGKTFQLLDQNNNLITEATTKDGMVWFEGLTPGTYTVQENPVPVGFKLTTNPNERTFTILSGQELVYEDGAAMLPADDQRTEVNIGDQLRWGNTKLAMLGDFVWEDLNTNGLQDSDEPGVADVKVTLTGGGANGIIDGIGDTTEMTTTADGSGADPLGFYKFNNLNPGEEYKVTFELPDEFASFTSQYATTGVLPAQNPATDSNVDPDPASASFGMTEIVTLSSGEFNDTLDAGLRDRKPPDPGVLPEVKLEKFVRVDRNPLDITKLVAVQPIASQSGDLCDTLGDPVKLTFGYIPGTTVMTGQDSGKARILFQGPVDNYGTSFIVVSDEDDPTKALSGDGDQYFRGNVEIGDTFAASENFAGDNFGSKTFVHFFENQNGELLQSIEYHTSCSQEIRLGDVIGNATLFGYDGKDGSLSIPGPQFVDANQAPGPETLVGNDVDFRYEVRNTGNSPISGVTVTDDRLDNVTFVEGDNNNNNQLDVNEVWIYEASETAGLGLQTNKGTATGIFGGQKFMAMDLANYTGIETPSSPSVIPPTPNPGNGNGIIFEVDDPFDPNNIGEDANSPTGPVAELNDKVTFTYRVTNPGTVPIKITSTLPGMGFGPVDDNKTPEDPTDDFVPASVLKAKGTNFGDDNANGLVDPGEEWYFQAMEFADEGGQQSNDSKVVAEDSEGNMVMDTDPANYLVNPLNLEKLVAVEQIVEGGDVCETAGKPESLTFTYLPSLIIDTNQKPGQVEFKNDNPMLDDDGEVYIETNKDFSGTVEIGEEFTVFATGGDLTFKIYDFQGGPLLQDIEKYHLSCSQPITLGDILGSVTLTGYTGEDGSASIPTPVFVDADNPPGPEAIIGTTVNFRYEVTNTGTEPLSNVNVTDDKLNPEAIEEGGFNVGDLNQDNFLDVDEKWLFAGSEIANEGLQTNKGTATAKLDGTDLMDMDPANYTGVNVPPPSGDLCDIFGDPQKLTFEYNPNDTVMTSQDPGKADILFDSGAIDDDGVSFIVVSDKENADDALNFGGKQFFRGDVPFNETFAASEDFDNDSFGSTTFIHFFDDSSSSGGLLQSIEYHTSCSQPIQANDVIGNATLVGYTGETGGF